MIKSFFILSASCLLLGVANADDLLIKDKKGVGVNEQQLQFFLKSQGDNAYQQILKDKVTIKKVLGQMYATTATANEVRKSVEWQDKNSQLNLELKILIDKFLQAKKIKEIESQPLPNFEKLAKQRFNLKKADYKEPEKVHAGHILIVVDKRRTKQQALAILNDIQKQLVAGADFSQIASEKSEDPSAAKDKGDLGVFEAKKMVKPFSDAAFKLRKKGELSSIIETKYGLHIIKLFEYFPERPQTFDEVKVSMIKKMTAKYKEEQRLLYFEELKAKNKVKINTEQLDVFLSKELKSK